MRAETIIIIAFSAANVIRLFAYVPQIALLLSRKDASSVSSSTWSMFFVSNCLTAVYAGSVTADTTMAIVFMANTVCCGIIVALVHWNRKKRRQTRSPGLSAPQALLPARPTL